MSRMSLKAENLMHHMDVMVWINILEIGIRGMKTIINFTRALSLKNGT